MSELDVQLSSDQTEKILQFQDLTGIEDLSVCRDALVRHSWDLEAAVQDQLNIREGRPSVFASDNNPPLVVSDVARQDVFVSERHREPWPWYYGGTFGFAASFLFRFFYDTVTSIIRLGRMFFWPPRRFPLTDPVGDVLRHIRQFEENYGHNHPVFYQGTYSQAVNDAKNELRFLLIHLHSENAPDSVSFCRSTLVDSEVITFINENNILFWSCSINSGEGQRVMDSIHCSVYPFIGVIVFKEGRMLIVSRLYGFMTPSVLLDRLTGIMVDNGTALLAARAERIERSINQSLREQQDEAYMASLLADQNKQKVRMEEENKIKLLEEEKERLIQEAQQKIVDIENKKKEATKKVPLEPDASNTETVCIVFKMPNGDRLERKFLPSHTLQDIYHFILGRPELSAEFEISTNFPKRILECTVDSVQTLKEAGLGSKEVLFIYDLKA